jgi:hypothetical protein
MLVQRILRHAPLAADGRTTSLGLTRVTGESHQAELMYRPGA